MADDLLAALLIQSNATVAFKTADHIRHLVETLTADPVSISIGLASYPTDALTAADLLPKAQEALLEGKNNGHNRVFWFEEEPVSERGDKQ